MEILKKCTCCDEEKPLSEFANKKAGTNGKSCYCKKCMVMKATKYNKAHKIKCKKNAAKYYNENKETILERRKKYYIANKEKKVNYQRKYRQRKSEKIKTP